MSGRKKIISMVASGLVAFAVNPVSTFMRVAFFHAEPLNADEDAAVAKMNADFQAREKGIEPEGWDALNQRLDSEHACEIEAGAACDIEPEAEPEPGRDIDA